MDLAIPFLVFCGLLAGFLVVSRVISWIAGLVLTFQRVANAESPLPTAVLPVQLVLHSGPWCLALAIGAIYYVASLSQPAWLWAFLSGIGLALAMLSAAVAFAHLRRRQKQVASVPLTPERLAKIRRRFFWIISFYFGGVSAAWELYLLWPYPDHDPVFVAFVIAMCGGGGYVVAWFMWQLYGASLEAREQARQRRERKNAV